MLERSMELQRKMAAGEKLPFDKVKKHDTSVRGRRRILVDSPTTLKK